MGLKVKLPGVVFSDPTLPKLYADAVMGNGALYLVDFSHPGGYDFGAATPVEGTLLPNVAWETAAALIGAGDRNTLSSTAKMNLSATEGKVEFTGKKGLHIITSQVNNGTNGKRFRVDLPAPIKTYIYNNINTRQFYVSVWGRVTRVTPNAVGFPAANIILATAGTPTANQLTVFEHAKTRPESGVKLLGQRNTTYNTVGTPYFRNVGVNGYTGTLGAEATVDMYWKNGPDGAYGNFEINKSASMIFYRIYIEDLTASGRTYAQADVADYALYQAAFAVGGRFNGDTFTDPATLA